MTQTDKNPFADLETSTAATKTPDKQELDFSFFDEPASPAPQQNSAVDNDFSFFDDPILAPAAGQQEKQSDTSFSFDDVPPAMQETEVPQENTVQETNLASVDSVKQPMLFSCLKCAHQEPLDVPEHLEQNLSITCSSCSSAIRISLEANAKRATQKSREIYCSRCGHTLDQHPHCPSCGQFCPDYYIVENPAEAQRKARAARSNNIQQTLANLKSSLTWTPRIRTTGSKSPQFSTTSSKSGFSFAVGNKQIKLITGAAVVISCLGIAAFYYLKLQAEQRYVENYIKATYAIFVGSDAIMNTLSKTSTEWKTAQTAGTPYIPRTDTDMEIRVARINSELSKLMQQTQAKVPGKFEQANSKLLDFQGELNQLQKATAKAPTSYDQLSALINGSDNKLKQKREALKASLNEELKTELDSAKKKFRGFAEF